MSAVQNPAAFSFQANDSLGTPMEPEFGMSLRDWFAGQALAGGLANADEHNFATPQEAAMQSYEIADAMLAERAKGGDA